MLSKQNSVNAGADLIFIVGRQRSGTTVFRELLKTEGAYNCDEIFHGDLERPDRFYAFVLDKVRENPKYVHPQSHGALFGEFITSLQQKAGGRPLAMDVKYFGLNLVPTREDVDGSQPFIIRYMVSSKAQVVHIIRKNKLRILVSQTMAQKTAVWSATKAHDLVANKPKLTLQCDQIIPFIENLLAQDARVQKLLGSTPNTHTLIYEDMFDGAEFSDQTIEIASIVMGRTGLQPTPQNLRMNPDALSELVENFEQVASLLKDTRFAWMLEDD